VHFKNSKFDSVIENAIILQDDSLFSLYMIVISCLIYVSAGTYVYLFLFLK
jgi:hypothetical protein